MREECSMEKRKARRARRAFSAEFKADAVRVCKVGDRTVRQVAEDLDLTETALREWVKRADVDAGKGPPEVLTTAERDEQREPLTRMAGLDRLYDSAGNSGADAPIALCSGIDLGRRLVGGRRRLVGEFKKKLA
jgi:transposase